MAKTADKKVAKKSAKKVAKKSAKNVATGAPTGSNNGASKLTEAKVKKIRSSHADGESKRSLALKFDVSARTIDQIVRRKTWTQVA